MPWETCRGLLDRDPRQFDEDEPISVSIQYTFIGFLRSTCATSIRSPCRCARGCTLYIRILLDGQSQRYSPTVDNWVRRPIQTRKSNTDDSSRPSMERTLYKYRWELLGKIEKKGLRGTFAWTWKRDECRVVSPMFVGLSNLQIQIQNDFEI